MLKGNNEYILIRSVYFPRQLVQYTGLTCYENLTYIIVIPKIITVGKNEKKLIKLEHFC